MSGPSESGLPIINTGESAKKRVSVSRDELKIDTRPKTPGTCYRDGEYLVVAGTGELNLLVDRCVKTNEQTSERRVFSGRSPRRQLDPIGRHAARFYVTVEYPIAKSWLMRQRLLFAAAGMMVTLGFAMILPMLQTVKATKWDWLIQYSCYGGVGLFCAGLAWIFWLWKSVTLYPIYPIAERGGYTWFRGVGRPFLDSLPPRPGTGV